MAKPTAAQILGLLLAVVASCGGKETAAPDSEASNRGDVRDGGVNGADADHQLTEVAVPGDGPPGGPPDQVITDLTAPDDLPSGIPTDRLTVDAATTTDVALPVDLAVPTDRPGNGDDVASVSCDPGTWPVDATCLPGVAPVPTTEGFRYQKVLANDLGVVFFLDQDGLVVHRFDLTNKTFSKPLSLDMAASSMAVDPDGATLFLGSVAGRIDVVNLTTGVRSFFGTAAEAVSSMLVLPKHLFTVDGSGFLSTRSLFDLASGQRVFLDPLSRDAEDTIYADKAQMVFTQLSGSPNDIIKSVYDSAAGTLSKEMESPYHGDYPIEQPLRVFPAQDRLVTSSGVIFTTNDLRYAGSIGFSYVDLRFHADRLYLIESSATSGLGLSPGRLRILDGAFNILETVVIQGSPELLFIHAGELVVLTRDGQGRFGHWHRKLP